MPSKTSRPSSGRGAADTLGVLEGRATGHDREAREESPVGIVEEVVAPLDGPAQGALPLGQVARAAREQRESTRPAGHGAPPRAASAVVRRPARWPGADRRAWSTMSATAGALASRQREVRPRRHGSLDEEAHRFRGGHVRDSRPRPGRAGTARAPGTRARRRCSAGCGSWPGRPRAWAVREEARDGRAASMTCSRLSSTSRTAPVAQVRHETVQRALGTRWTAPSTVAISEATSSGSLTRVERHEERPVREARRDGGRDLDGEPRLARAARAGERHEARAREQT